MSFKISQAINTIVSHSSRSALNVFCNPILPKTIGNFNHKQAGKEKIRHRPSRNSGRTLRSPGCSAPSRTGDAPAVFPAAVTKMLANAQSIRCAFCLTCQKTGRRASTLRIVRYCLNIHYQFVTIAAKCKNPSFENVLCFKRERAVSRAPQACRSI